VTATEAAPTRLADRFVDTADLRTGPPVHDGLLALLPLIGRWAGPGSVRVPATGAVVPFTQQVEFVHDGRPFLAYRSWTWFVDGDGTVLRAGARETGFWRPGAGPDDVEAVLALNTGLTLVLTGLAGDLRWDLSSARIGSTPTAKEVAGNRRLYAVVDGSLTYAQELARAGEDFEPHLSARLERR